MGKIPNLGVDFKPINHITNDTKNEYLLKLLEFTHSFENGFNKCNLYFQNPSSEKNQVFTWSKTFTITNKYQNNSNRGHHLIQGNEVSLTPSHIVINSGV